MERCKLRRTSFVDAIFGTTEELSPGIGLRLPGSSEAAFAPSRPLGLLSDPADDVLIVPGFLAVRRGTTADERLSGMASFETVELGDQTSEVVVYRALDDAPVDAVRAVLAQLAESSDAGLGADLAPVHGFVCHQKVKSSDDPESSAAVPVPTSRRGAGGLAEILDTGLAADWAWSGRGLAAASAFDVDPLESALDPAYLGRSAGHGTFVASLCHQVAPGAKIVVRRVASTEGLLDELTLAARLNSIGADGNIPDVVIMAFGGYSVKLGSFGTHGSGDTWSAPLVLRDALAALLSRCPGTVVVASAGNNDSSDPCYPAAFAAEAGFAGRVVSVAALDSSGYRWSYSNYGRWVSASALGVHLRGPYVEGREHPSNEPDGSPETFVAPAYASWSGTSFAAPLVAGRILEIQAALAGQLRRTVTATEAWQVLRASSKPQREGRCGMHVLVDGVAHD